MEKFVRREGELCAFESTGCFEERWWNDTHSTFLPTKVLIVEKDLLKVVALPRNLDQIAMALTGKQTAYFAITLLTKSARKTNP